jgi:hypothetical protein
MEIRKTHFEQVPLEMVLRMIAEQSRREELTQQELATSNDAAKTTPEGDYDKSLKKPSTARPLDEWTKW